VNLSARDLNLILAALRYWQRAQTLTREALAAAEYECGAGAFAEIDALIYRLNRSKQP
jgi:hypothetical protein